MDSPEALSVDAICDGRKARLTYRSMKNDGALIVQYDGEQLIICDRNVIAVIPHETHTGSYFTVGFISTIWNEYESDGTSLQVEAIIGIADLKFNAIEVTNLPRAFVDANVIGSSSILHRSYDILPRPDLSVIVSIRSGAGQAKQFFDTVVVKALTFAGFTTKDYELHVTTSDKSIQMFAREKAKSHNPQYILLLSGDGGVVDVVNAIPDTLKSRQRSFIGVIPLGTGNALANSTGLNMDSTHGLRQFFRGQDYALPTFTATFSPGSGLLINEGNDTEPLTHLRGAVVCSWGLHASLVADSDVPEYRKHGSERFQMVAKKLLETPHNYKAKIILFKKGTEGKEYTHVLDRREHSYILATLVSNLEKNLTISPSSQPLDGQLRLVHFGPMEGEGVMRIMGLAFQGGSHVHDPLVHYEDIEGMRIEFEEDNARWRRICVDGKIISVAKGGWMELKKNDMSFLNIVADLAPRALPNEQG